MDTKIAPIGLTVILLTFALPAVAEKRGRDSGHWRVIGFLSGILMLVITAFLGGTLISTINLPKPEADALLKLLGPCSIPLGPALCILWLWLRGPLQPSNSAEQTNSEALSPKDSNPNPTRPPPLPKDFIKTNRILGRVWLVLCVYFGFTVLWRSRDDFANFESLRPEHYGTIVMSLIYLVGIVASIFLLRGVRWAGIAVGVVALFKALMMAGYYLVLFTSAENESTVPTWLPGVIGVFSIVSAILLLKPRRHAIANP